MDKKCIFCEIVNGNIKSFEIYEDDLFQGLLDVMPKTKGHTLIIPKRHIEYITDLNNEESQKIVSVIQKIVKMLQDKLSPNGFTIGINHGKVAGQAVEHLHIHIIPRYENDGGGSLHSIISGHYEGDLEDVFNQIIK